MATIYILQPIRTVGFKKLTDFLKQFASNMTKDSPYTNAPNLKIDILVRISWASRIIKPSMQLALTIHMDIRYCQCYTLRMLKFRKLFEHHFSYCLISAALFQNVEEIIRVLQRTTDRSFNDIAFFYNFYFRCFVRGEVLSKCIFRAPYRHFLRQIFPDIIKYLFIFNTFNTTI